MAPTFVAAKHSSQREHVSDRASHTRAKRFHDSVNVLRLYAVNDEVAASRNEVTIQHDLDLGLGTTQQESSHV